MFEHAVQSLLLVCSFEHLLALSLGLVAGMVVGALPGLTTTMGMALFVPFTFGHPPTIAFLFLLGLYSGGVFGGAIPAILVSTPGTPASCVTVLDGYPLTKQGRAAEALSAAVVSSAIGGLISALMLLLIAPQLARFGLKFGAHEYCALGLLGLSTIISMSGDSWVKGLIAGVLGLLLSTVGMDLMVGYPRFTFGFYELFEGLPFVPLMIGLFALSEILLAVEERGRGFAAKVAEIGRVGLQWGAVRTYKAILLKSGLIGTLVGILPGTGGAVASLLAYNEAKRSAKEPGAFGKGAVEGVCASEAANNAVTGGAMIPLLTLAIPGDSVTAILLGAFLIHGYQVGPLFVTEQASLFYTIGFGLIVINLVMLAFGLMAAKYFAYVLKVPRYTLYPVVFVLAVVGSYALKTSLFDVAVMLIAGAAGYVFKKEDIPLMPLILGLILGPMVEVNFRRSLLVGSLSLFLTRPISLALLLLAGAVVIVSALVSRRATGKGSVAETR